jgi:DNA-binding NarL/FixJ family response regulator
MSGDKERVLDAGFTGYIPKPYDATTLAEQIREALQSASHPADEDTPAQDSN